MGARRTTIKSLLCGMFSFSTITTISMPSKANYVISTDWERIELPISNEIVFLDTIDSGKTWSRIPLSAKLPGTPFKITATGEGKAEMITDQGAIYTTSNTAKTWQANVEETVDATLNRTVSSGISGASYFEGYFSNVSRGFNGQYVAVSSRGNFFMTWAPGERNWMPHNRPKGRRLQNMGWGPNDILWLTSRGGEVLLGNTQ